MPPSARRARLGLAAVAVLLAACGTPLVVSTPGTTAAAKAPTAWVELGPQASVRAAVAAGTACPALAVDGHAVAMAVRVPAATIPWRPDARGPTRPAAFPVDVCEARLTAGAHALALDARPLPAIVAAPARIVVLGDTGCRLKGTTIQDCADPDGWPFPALAATAAALRPDLVIHVGDYHYRETPCPAGHRGCAGSPWGYGWDAWDADFFRPARPLLAAAPWVFVRGNHEECARAGQGWFRFLAPEPWTPARSCDDPAHDLDADFTPPYAVPLGGQAQLVVADSAAAGNDPLDAARPRDAAIRRHYLADARRLAALVDPGVRTWYASHHPVLAFAPSATPGAPPAPGNPALRATLAEANGAMTFPPGVQVALHGHVHLFQALGFADGHPAALVAGNGGDLVDPDLPDPLPPGAAPAPGVRVAQATYSGSFGFLLLERLGDDGRWRVTAHRRDGSILTQCALSPAGELACDPAGWRR